MARHLQRIERLEGELAVGADRQEFERLTREAYNRRMSLSPEGLAVTALAILAGVEPPAWAVSELQKPIPPDANPRLVREAETEARESLRMTTGPIPEPGGTDWLGMSMKEFSELVADMISCLSQRVGRKFSDIDEVGRWIVGPGQTFRPVRGLVMISSQDEGGRSEAQAQN